jgi:hypothetical protein
MDMGHRQPIPANAPNHESRHAVGTIYQSTAKDDRRGCGHESTEDSGAVKPPEEASRTMTIDSAPLDLGRGEFRIMGWKPNFRRFGGALIVERNSSVIRRNGAAYGSGWQQCDHEHSHAEMRQNLCLSGTSLPPLNNENNTPSGAVAGRVIARA